MNKNEQRSQSAAFTLIELLVVIGIIGILAGLLLPAVGSVKRRAKVTKAQTAIANLTTAFKVYYTEYGKWPVSESTSNLTYVVDTNLVVLLQGVNNTASLTAESAPGAGPPFNPLSTSKLQGNPRAIRFFDFKQSELDGTGAFIDPWNQHYYCRFDVSYANQVADPFAGGGNVSADFLVWSSGPDAKYDNTGDASPLNTDNIKSW